MIKTLNDYFDKIYCINLDEVSDRWNNCTNQFNKYKISVERFPGIKTHDKDRILLDGELGCLMSHLKILEIALENNFENVLILEDDVIFVDNFDTIFEEKCEKIPLNWDLLYLGGNHLGRLIPINDGISKMTYTYTTHAIGVKNNMYKTLIDLISNHKYQVDVYYARIMSKINAYTFKESLAYQMPGYSYIQNK